MKKLKYTFCRKLNSKYAKTFLHDDNIIVTSSVDRTQCICALFSPPVIYHNSNDKQHSEKKTNKLNKKLMSHL